MGEFTGQNKLFLSLLKKAWPDGVHSHDLRIKYEIGDPSARMRDVNAKLGAGTVYADQENRGKKNGVRYFLHRQEAEAIPNLPSKSDTSAAPASSPSRANSGRECPTSGRTGPPAGRGVGQPLPEVTLVDLERACAWALEADSEASLETALRATPIRSRRVEMQIAGAAA